MGRASMAGALNTFTTEQGPTGAVVDSHIVSFDDFAKDLGRSSFDMQYVFIEPSYDIYNDYRDGTSQHPLGDVTRGEALIKTVYETIRASSIWESSLLVITWDE